MNKPRQEIVINNRSFSTLVDNGADVSLVSFKCATEMKPYSTSFPNEIHFAVVNKANHTQTEVEIKIPADNMVTRHRFIIVEYLKYDVIVAIYLMMILGLYLSVDEEAINFPNGLCFRYSSLCKAMVYQSEIA